MKKALCLIEGRHVKKYRTGRTCRPMTVVRNRLFRTDDRLFCCDQESSECILIYDLDSTQPYGNGKERIDSDVTMALIDIARTNQKKSIGVLGTIMGMKPMTFVYIAVAFAIILSLFGVH